MTPDRACTCDRATAGGPYRAGDCVFCWHWHNSPELRRAFGDTGGPGPASPPAPPAPPPPTPCAHEGPVVSWATCVCESKHVRQCLHDEGPDLCVRGPSADPAVRSCAGCPLRG